MIGSRGFFCRLETDSCAASCARRAADNQAGEGVFLSLSGRDRRRRVACEDFLRLVPVLAGNKRFVPPFIELHVLGGQADGFELAVHHLLACRAAGAGGVACIMRVVQQEGHAAVGPLLALRRAAGAAAG